MPVLAADEISDSGITVGSVAGNPGETVDVSVSLAHNPGIAAFVLRLNYDASMLTPISIIQGPALHIGSITSNLQAGGDPTKLNFVSAVWINSSDFTGDGVIYTVTFAISQYASGNIPLTLTYNPDDIVNQNLENIRVAITNGNILIAPPFDSYTPEPPVAADVSDPNANASSHELPQVTTDREPQPETDNAAISTDSTFQNNQFNDISASDWFYESVGYVFNSGLMNGTSEYAFEPHTPVSRAMFATILYRMENEPSVNSGNPFPDVSAGQWYTNAVIWANENEIMLGYGDKFGANDPITREQLATILYRYTVQKGNDANIAYAGALEGYADYNQISAWATTALTWANAKGIITGRSATELIPSGTASRAETAAMLQRFIVDSG
jgi:hypothetical protein